MNHAIDVDLPHAVECRCVECSKVADATAPAFSPGSSQAPIRRPIAPPAFIETPLARQFLAKEDVRSWVLGRIKLGRIGTVEDLMGAVVFLASDTSSLMTGSAMVVDGGWAAD
jgi:NAD(P)-dependent dehydrogenase (short-subunit alcohol dehydrogenase family)